jgi:hypothetical protein
MVKSKKLLVMKTLEAKKKMMEAEAEFLPSYTTNWCAEQIPVIVGGGYACGELSCGGYNACGRNKCWSRG